MASAFSSSCWQMRMGAVLAAASVGLGAYGAHGMAKKEDEFKKVWSTAVQYNQLGAVSTTQKIVFYMHVCVIYRY